MSGGNKKVKKREKIIKSKRDQKKAVKTLRRLVRKSNLK